MPKPLLKRLVLTFLVGIGCLFVGVMFFLWEKDSQFLYLSILIFLCSVGKDILLFSQIKKKSYILIEGTCQSVRPQFFRNCNEVILSDQDGNEHCLLLGNNQKVHPGFYYRIYFKTPSGISPGKNPIMEKALLTDNLLGVEAAEPPASIP